ncbi:GTP-binding protein [Methanonatronarchaeum sp. AMET-Sl]|uniref:GTPBP1 family GTP-binding protein n=1 Tax=Methanonatronarchaeum sp. AMET-Sl TaxID=3037654 RepID=UPI00244E3A9E|nr:GTP-binding protein [Methanonatronarchaeum sp. AMET-Sl]WGI17770.1 GTP-binding protein [Methanonatronarchaeum sp. AMET-Sl]
MNELKKLINKGENGDVEFKEILKKDIHLNTDRKMGLASQLKYRLLEGNGSARYIIGVRDDGTIRGLNKTEFNETTEVINKIAEDIGAQIVETKTQTVDGKKTGLIKINSKSNQLEHLIIGTAGHVDHGKSTLLGAIVTGKPDNGSGKARSYFDVQPHEIERGLSADLSYGVYGFDEKGQPIKLKNPLNNQEKSEVISNGVKAISFVDTVGHEPWLRTTIRGIVGQKLDYGLLVVAADDGVTHVTKEHLGILLAMDLPTIVAITKTDLVEPERTKEVLEQTTRLIKKVGKVPYRIKDKKDIQTIINKQNDVLIPIIKTSAVTMEGIPLLDRLFYCITPRQKQSQGPFRMYIDKVYKVTGIGRVVSGTVMTGKIKTGEKALLGPIDNEYKEVKIQTIEMHHHRVEEASAGEIVGISVKGAEKIDIKRGMALCSPQTNPETVKEFIADIVVLNHPTKIEEGYEPVIHIETISEATKFTDIKGDYITAGEKTEAKLKFKFNSHYVHKGQKFIFREGKSKGIGTIKQIIK